MTKLNLSEIVWPICLLKCDAALRELSVGGKLDLTVKDAHLLDALSRIISSHPNLTYEINQVGDHYHIMVNRLQKRAEMMSTNQKHRQGPS